MTEERRPPIDDAISPSPADRFADGPGPLMEKCGLTWRGLAARTGVFLEDFTRRWGLPLERATRLRFHDVPTAAEMRAILEWACTVRGGVEVLLRDSDEPWRPTRGRGGYPAPKKVTRIVWSAKNDSQSKIVGKFSQDTEDALLCHYPSGRMVGSITPNIQPSFRA